MNWKGLVDYVVARAGEQSTWAAVVGILAAAGYVLGPEQTQALSQLGVAVSLALGVLLKENGS